VASKDVVADAAAPVIKEMMIDLDVRTARMYELLSKDNPYPKLWRILLSLGKRNPEGLRHIQADFNARCEALLSETVAPITAAKLHKELSDVVQCHLAEKPVDEQRRELIEAVSVCQHRLEDLNAVN
jgi:hypothetical protein